MRETSKLILILIWLAYIKINMYKKSLVYIKDMLNFRINYYTSDSFKVYEKKLFIHKNLY